MKSLSRTALPVLLAATFTMVAAACGSEAPPHRAEGVVGLTGDQVAGKTLFEDNCAGCHVQVGEKMLGPDLSKPPRSDLSALTMATVIIDGQGTMNAFAADLTDQQIADVVAYVKGEFAGK